MNIKNFSFVLLPVVFVPEVMAATMMPGIQLEGALGLLNGSSTELVYRDGKKLSQLDWEIENVPIIKLGATRDINEQLTFKGGLWSVMNDDGDAHMEDRDWLTPNQSSPSDISIHPDTKLRNAYEIDLNATYWLAINSNYRMGALVGYQYNQFKWDGIGGTYRYNNGANVGAFSNIVVIDYKQEFQVFYLGFAGEYNIDRSEFFAQVKWSPLVDAKGVDNHRLRNLTFYEQSNGDSDFVSLTLNYGYNFTPRAKLYAEYVYTVYEEAKADTKLVNNTTGQVSYSPNSAGLDNENSTVSVGIKLIF